MGKFNFRAFKPAQDAVPQEPKADKPEEKQAFPDAQFGEPSEEEQDEELTDDPADADDDEELAETPEDVVAQLGFDPAKEDSDEA